MWAGTRPAPACGRLGWEEIKSIRNLKKYTKENSHGQSLAPNGALSLYLRDILASKLAVYPVGRDSPLQGQSLPMTKIAKA